MTIVPTATTDIDIASMDASQAPRFYEAVSAEAFVTYAYRVILNRAPDPDGLNHYRGWISAGGGRRRVAEDLFRSREFRDAGQLRGGAHDPEAFVRHAYETLLGRAADPSGLAHYAGKARSAKGRQRVLRDIASSAEARKRNGHRTAHQRALRRFIAERVFLAVPVLGGVIARHNALMAGLARIEAATLLSRAGTHAVAPMAMGNAPVLPAPNFDTAARKSVREVGERADDRNAVLARDARKWLLRRIEESAASRN